MFHLSFLDQLLYCASNFFNRYIRVNAMLIEEIDAVRAEPLQ